MEAAIIAAVADNRVIGNKGKMPWHISEDLQRFKSLTQEHPVIMGRKTFESLGKPLGKRLNIVLTKGQFNDSRVVICRGLSEALYFAEQNSSQDPYIIGGESVYREAMQRDEINRLEITEVHGTYEGDSFFPEIDKDVWKEKERIKQNGYDFVTYQRKK